MPHAFKRLLPGLRRGKGQSALRNCTVQSGPRRNRVLLRLHRISLRSISGNDGIRPLFRTVIWRTTLRGSSRSDLTAYRAELEEKIKILHTLLDGYNDGRRKTFYCTAVALLDLDAIRDVMDGLAQQENDEMAATKGRYNDGTAKNICAVRLFEQVAGKAAQNCAQAV